MFRNCVLLYVSDRTIPSNKLVLSIDGFPALTSVLCPWSWLSCIMSRYNKEAASQHWERPSTPRLAISRPRKFQDRIAKWVKRAGRFSAANQRCEGCTSDEGVSRAKAIPGRLVFYYLHFCLTVSGKKTFLECQLSKIICPSCPLPTLISYLSFFCKIMMIMIVIIIKNHNLVPRAFPLKVGGAPFLPSREKPWERGCKNHGNFHQYSRPET